MGVLCAMKLSCASTWHGYFLAPCKPNTKDPSPCPKSPTAQMMALNKANYFAISTTCDHDHSML